MVNKADNTNITNLIFINNGERIFMSGDDVVTALQTSARKNEH